MVALFSARASISSVLISFDDVERFLYIHLNNLHLLGGFVRVLPAVLSGTLFAELSNENVKEDKLCRGETRTNITDKQKRKAEHIEEGYRERGVSEEEAERRAWAIVNATHHGGEKPGGGGYGKPENKEPARKGGRRGGSR